MHGVEYGVLEGRFRGNWEERITAYCKEFMGLSMAFRSV